MQPRSHKSRGVQGTVDQARGPFGYNPKGLLTPRQEEILGLMAQGYGDKAIAEKLCVLTRTVSAHASKIYQVLGLNEFPRNMRNHRASAIYWYLCHHPELLSEEPLFNLDVLPSFIHIISP